MPTSSSSMPEPRRRPPSAPMAGAVLAAGRGRRMGEMGWLPKTLLPVAGRPMLERQLALFDALGLERVVVVVGDNHDAVADYLETTGRLGRGVDLVRQPTATGSGDALLCLEDHLDLPFVLFLGDILLQPVDDLAPLVEPVASGAWDATLAVVEERDDDRLGRNFRVDVDADDRVVGVEEKPAGGAPALKGCGLYAFSPAVFEAARRTPRRADGDRGITDCVQSLVDLGRPVRAARVVRWDLNLNRADDLVLDEARLESLEAGRPTRPALEPAWRLSSPGNGKEKDPWRRTTA